MLSLQVVLRRVFVEEKIVVTGLGTINSLGKSVQETWGNVLNGVSGTGPLTRFDASSYIVQIACEVKDYEATSYMLAKEARRRDLFEQFALISTQQAMEQAGLEISPANTKRVGVFVAAAIGGLSSLQDAILTVRDDGPRRISPFAIPMLMPNGASGMISIEHGINGPSVSVASACASGADGIGMSWVMLRAGLIDVAIAGASEAPITAVGVSAFDRLGALSRKDPQAGPTPQPFDLNRDGLVIGEGAAVLILERESHAKARGAEILAELAGYAATADAFHVTAPADDGAGGRNAMQQSLERAHLNLDEVDYINAHGTATVLNDVSETQAIKALFGNMAYNIPVSSTKSMTGHMMGATAALEALFCVQVLSEGIIPPTINYETPDPACDLDYVPNTAREIPVKVAMSNAFGFGGHNAVLVFKAYA
jgi:beta-ketoacyl-acyl-carrier-protein synthase II